MTTLALEPFYGAVTQVAMVTPDLESTLAELTRAGVGPFLICSLDSRNVTDLMFRGRPTTYSIRFALAESAGMSWEVIQPLEGINTYTEFLANNPLGGLQHVAVDCGGVPFEERVAGLAARGCAPVQSGTAFGVVPFAYFTSHAPGMPLIEIFDMPEGFDIGEYADGWFPARPQQ